MAGSTAAGLRRGPFPVLLAAALLAAGCGQLETQREVERIDRTLVEEYCRLVADGQYAEAHERCLSADYREQAPVAGFVAAHERRRAEVGTVLKRRLVDFTSSRQLFTWVRQHHLLYAVEYPGREERLYVVVDDEDGEYRIEGTYVSGAGDTLDFKLW